MNTAGRRRQQAVNNYHHLSRQRRPHYTIVSAEKAKNRLSRLIQSEQARRNRKK